MIYIYIYTKKMWKYLNKKYRFCNNLYTTDKNKKFIIIKNIISKSLAQQIIEEAENYAKENKWKTDRHEHYPTVDNVFTEKWTNFHIIENIIQKKIYTEIVKLYNVKYNQIGINEIFVVKYDMNGQKKLEEHKDGSEFSFIIALNDEYQGGGTYFTEIKKQISLGTGDCLIFSGQNKHKGVQIKSGKRYILTGFLHFHHRDYCEEILS